MTKVISFPQNRIKYLYVHVTPSMITGLITARHKHLHQQVVNKEDFDGGFKALYKNQMINVNIIKVNGRLRNAWYVTYLGKKALKAVGIKPVY